MVYEVIAKMDENKRKVKPPVTQEVIFKIMMTITFAVSAVFFVKNLVGKNTQAMFIIGACLLVFTVIAVLMNKMRTKQYTKQFILSICLVVLVFCILLGLPSSLGFGAWSGFTPLGMDILTFFDFLSNTLLMPIVALLTCIFVGYVIKPKALIAEAEESGKFSGKLLFTIVIRYVAPIFIVAILIFSTLEAFGVIKV